MLYLWISRRSDELLALTAALDARFLLIDMVLALVAASASLEMPSMSTVGWTLSSVHFKAPL
jgi:hypothetical protein